MRNLQGELDTFTNPYLFAVELFKADADKKPFYESYLAHMEGTVFHRIVKKELNNSNFYLENLELIEGINPENYGSFDF